MKYYKVIKDTKLIDVLDKLVFVRFQLKHKILLLCDESEAEGILSSDRETAWHINTLKKFPIDSFDNVSIEEIDYTEYRRLKNFCMMTVEEVIDAYTKELLIKGVL